MKRETNRHAFKLLFLYYINSLHSDSLHYYTDGSRTDDGVGSAVVSHNIQHKFLNIYSRREICDALKLINDDPNRYITIFTDSRNALYAIEIYNSDHPIVSEIRDWLIQLQSRHHSIQLCWVSSHIDSASNERADQEDRVVITNGVVTPDTISHSISSDL